MRQMSFLGIVLCSCLALAAQNVGVVSHVKVTSDKVQDVSSLEAWKTSFIKPDMTDQEKALAVWRSVVMFRHQDIPPNEFLETEEHPHDPIEDFNVYGYGQCCCASANIEALARYIGMDVRGWGITGHSVPEISIGGRWCMFDASLINYFQKPDGSIAGVEEVGSSITDWFSKHADLKDNEQKLRNFMPRKGWKNGPEIVAGGSGYDDNGWLPAATHGWYSTLSEFGHPKKNFIYDYGCAAGYEVNLQLRPGETITRNWSNKGLHVNMQDGGGTPACLNMPVGQDQLRYSPGFGDLAPGRIGNGTVEWNVPLDEPTLRDVSLKLDNLASGPGGTIRVKDSARPGEFILRMPSSYVYVGGQVTLDLVADSGGSVAVSYSENNGLDWKPIGTFTASGGQKIDLKPLIFRRYDYRLKFVLSGNGTGLKSLRIASDIQHSQRALPALDKGDNTIHFTAGLQEGTVSVYGLTEHPAKPKNLLFADFHPQLTNVSEEHLLLKGGKGQVLVPIQTPGDITRLRIGCYYRARDPKDGWTIDASFDGGKSYLPVGHLEGGHANFTAYLILDHVPEGSRSVLVRFSGVQRNTTLISDLRICADYREPHGSFAPVRVTYAWDEAGTPHQDVHVVHHPDETYSIHCDSKPLMKSIALQLAQ